MILGRAANDLMFRDRLVGSPDAALSEFDLTAAEYRALVDLCAEARDSDQASSGRHDFPETLPFWVSGGL